MKRFIEIDHPSDIGIVAYGKNFKETLENAAYGMFSLLSDLSLVKPARSLEVSASGETAEELVVNWLNELIYLFDAKKLLLSDFKITEIKTAAGQTRLQPPLTSSNNRAARDSSHNNPASQPFSLIASVRGEPLAPEKLLRSIKATTYNNLLVSPKKIQVVFDV